MWFFQIQLRVSYLTHILYIYFSEQSMKNGIKDLYTRYADIYKL